MTSGENEREEATPPEGAGDGMNLLIGWRADRAAAGTPEPDRSAGDAAGPGMEAAAVPAPDPAATLADLVAGQRRVLALLEELAPKHAERTDGGEPADLGEAARSIAAATEWASDIRAAMDSLLVTAGRSIRDLEKAEQGLAGEVAALKTREQGFDKQIELLAGGARTLGTRLQQLDEARQKLEERSAELQAVKQDIVGYYEEWTAAARAYRQQMGGLTDRLREGGNLVSRVEKAIGPWTTRMEESLDKNARAQELAAALTSNNVQRLTEDGDAFLEKFGAAWRGALEDFRAEWRNTRRWTVPVLAAVLVVMVPTLTVVGAVGQSKVGVFAPHDDTGGWKHSFWMRHGDQIRACAGRALETDKTVECRIEVTQP